MFDTCSNEVLCNVYGWIWHGNSGVPLEEVVCASVASIAEKYTNKQTADNSVVLARVYRVALSESARNWNCKIILQSVKLCEHGICGTTYVRYLIHTFIHSEEMHR